MPRIFFENQIQSYVNNTFNSFHNLNRLLERPRQCINIDNSTFQWDPNFSNSPDYIQSRIYSLYGDRAIFAMHNTLNTQSRFDTNQKIMRTHCNELYDLSEW